MITITNDDPKYRGMATYQCVLCGTNYSKISEAKACESRPVFDEKCIFPPETVLVTKGDGTGKLAEVFSRGVAPRVWGDRLWHTILLRAQLETGGVRTLDKDSCDRIGPGYYEDVSKWSDIIVPSKISNKMAKERKSGAIKK